MNQKKSVLCYAATIVFFLVTLTFAQEEIRQDQIDNQSAKRFPVTLDSDTLFNIYSGIGSFTAQKRAAEISQVLETLVREDIIKTDSIKIILQNGLALIKCETKIIMAVTLEDASANGKSIEALSSEYLNIIKRNVLSVQEIYSQKSIIERILYVIAFFAGFTFLMWINRLIFPRIYSFLEKLEGKIFKAVQVGKFEVLKGSSLVDLTTIILKGLRLFITLAAVYFLIVLSVTNLPWTRHWHIQPILRGILLFIFVSVAAFVFIKGVNASYRFFTIKFNRWKGTLIKSFRFKTIELLSEDKAVDLLIFAAKAVRTFLWIVIGYFYVTLVFSFFSFSQTWASKLVEYILGPLNSVLVSFINFLPNLFFIVVIVVVFNYLLKLVKYFFIEVEKEKIKLPGFHVDWATPTYKIVRFLIIVLAVIIIFPYLPGSDSDAFKGVSVFLGILFSLGSSSAISNIVSGTVLTYMRPFKLGDRVKIADTIGDVVEKTLLVTRIRTIKNVDVTIPNSMVLGSHIVNYSSSASDKGLILHTSVTIGYDAPWKQIHELLISAANETEFILKEPKPFVLQTSLDDFYVSYEINAYTSNPGDMAKIYSELHSKIQDKFNQAGVEIMSPHYSAIRDGNKIAIPDENISKDYDTPGFKFWNIEKLFSGKKKW